MIHHWKYAVIALMIGLGVGLSVGLGASMPVFAAVAKDSVIPPPVAVTGAKEQADIAQAETYLQGLTTAKARFLQTAPDGTQQIGTFYLSRPGRLRFNYDNSKDFVVADGYFIYFYDSQTKQQTNAPIGQTLADFLLRKKISLSGDLSVESVTQTNGLILIKVVQTNNKNAGSLTLAFADQPYRLKKWRVVDGTGAVTEVELFQLQNNVDLDSGLFAYSDPLQGKTVHFNQ
jgi:outer membrane lipoprotein-sorting protein